MWYNIFTCDPGHGTFQYGLAIRREHWRRGDAPEAIALVLRCFFHELRYQKVNVHIHYREHTAAIRRWREQQRSSS